MAVAAALARDAFANPVSGWVNMKLTNTTGAVAGTVLTVTKPDGWALSGPITQFFTNNQVKINVTSCTKPAGLLLLPVGSTVTG
jgi:hypothetical protein